METSSILEEQQLFTNVNNVSTTALIDTYLIQFFNTRNINIVNKNNKLMDILFDTSIKAKDSAINKFQIHLCNTNEKLDELKSKQVNLGYKTFTQFVNAALFDFYTENHDISEKPIIVKSNKLKKLRINLDTFNRYKLSAKKRLMTGKYASYDSSVIRESFTCKNEDEYIRSQSYNRDFAFHLVYYFKIVASIDEWLIIRFMRRLDKQKDNLNNYSTHIGQNVEDTNLLIPDIDTYFYLYLYYMYLNEQGNMFNYKIVFNTDDIYADKLLEKYTIENIFKKYLKDDIELDIYEMFDDEVKELLSNNELVNLNEIQNNII